MENIGHLSPFRAHLFRHFLTHSHTLYTFLCRCRVRLIGIALQTTSLGGGTRDHSEAYKG